MKLSLPTGRVGAVVATTALVASGLALTASPAQAAVDERPADIGATWLTGQLQDGLIPSQFGSPDYGLSIDAAFSLDAVGGHGDTIDAIADALGPDVVMTGQFNYGYAESDEYSFPGNEFVQKGYYAGPIAKALVFAETAGIADVQAWSGADLVGDLEDRVAGSAPIAGRIVDESSFGDYANVIGQAFAAHALEVHSSPKAAAVLSFLLKQQCTAGYFRLFFTPDKAAENQTCDGGRAAGESDADPDATSTAIRLLLPLADDPTVARAIGKAEAWLLAQQRADGSFLGGTSTAVPNTNSTAQAGLALGLLGDAESAERAAIWVRGHQADEVAGCASALSGQPGAIAYTDAALAAGRAGGISAGAAPEWRRASAQGLAVLQFAPAGTPALELDGPDGYVRAGSTATYEVTGAVPGDKVCIGGTTVAADADGAASAAVRLPAGTANRTVTVTARTGETDTVVTQALGSKVFTVVARPGTAKQGTLVRVRATGLAAGEKTRLTFRGTTLRTGKANVNGVWVVEINVRRTLGKGTVSVFGEFAGRRGITTVTVVR